MSAQHYRPGQYVKTESHICRLTKTANQCVVQHESAANHSLGLKKWLFLALNELALCGSRLALSEEMGWTDHFHAMRLLCMDQGLPYLRK